MAFRFIQQQQYKQPSYRRDATPSVYEAFGDDIGSSLEDGDGAIHIEHRHLPEAPAPARHHHRPRFVDFVEPRDGEKKVTKMEKWGVRRSVDDVAEGFIRENHRAFQLRQWNTFKM